MFGRNKTPSEKYIAADKRKQKLRDKRSKLDPWDDNFEKKDKMYKKKIHNENVKMEAAKMESKQPIKINKTTNVNASVNYNKTESGVHLHGHYHSSGKKKK